MAQAMVQTQTTKSYLDFTSVHNHMERSSDANAFCVA